MKNAGIDHSNDAIVSLMELDEWFGWSRRIDTMRKVFEPPSTSTWIYLLIVWLLLLGIGLTAFAVYIIFFY